MGYKCQQPSDPEDLAGGVPQSIYFDTTYVLQSYVYGDGSNSRLRFCIDEYLVSGWADHEVSKLVVVDWHGWKLVEWQLNDPNSVGEWISDGLLTGLYFRIDSYQLTKTTESSVSGAIYFDELRAVKKIVGTTGIKDSEKLIPNDFVLYQNYPNPFNLVTVISYQLPVSSNVTLKVYDILGKEVATLVDEYKAAGRYEAEFSTTGESASAVYFYQLKAEDFIQTKKMILLK